jgi:diacylglycerol O-acyltransferase
MLEAFPIVPLGGNLALSIAILSYDGSLTLGITTDPALVPDVDIVRRGIEQGFRAVGATRAGGRRRPRAAARTA